MDLFNWLSENQNLVTIISTIVLAFATLGLMFYTFMLYREEKKTRTIQESPDISISIEFLLDGLCLLVHNQGTASAYNIKIISDPNIKIVNRTKQKHINEISVMSLTYLRTGQWFIADIGKFSWITENNNDLSINFRVEFYNKDKVKYKRSIEIDIEQFKDGLASTKVNTPGSSTVVYTSSLPVNKMFSTPISRPPLAAPIPPQNSR